MTLNPANRHFIGHYCSLEADVSVILVSANFLSVLQRAISFLVSMSPHSRDAFYDSVVFSSLGLFGSTSLSLRW